jgi:phage shock protein PspC (stress-responsive transcriptional regulator)
MARNERLTRRPEEGMIAGVAAGLAHRYDIDVTLVRIALVVAAVVLPITPVIVVGYLAAAVLLPRAEDAPGLESFRHGMDDLVSRGRTFYEETRRVIDRSESRSAPADDVDAELAKMEQQERPPNPPHTPTV